MADYDWIFSSYEVHLQFTSILSHFGATFVNRPDFQYFDNISYSDCQACHNREFFQNFFAHYQIMSFMASSSFSHQEMSLQILGSVNRYFLD